MTKEPDKPVSLSKPDKAAGDPAAPSAPRPRTVTLAVAAMAVSAAAALLASVVLFGQGGWLHREQLKANSSAVRTAVSSAVASASKASKDVPAASASASASATKKYPLGGSSLHHQVSQQQSGALIGSIILVVAMAILMFGVYRGRHWSRWAVVAFWFLASFTGTFAGITYIFAIGGSLPAPFKIPLFVSATSLLVAVVLVNLRRSTDYFALSRPARPAGAPPRRGLFAPRPPAGGARTAGSGSARGSGGGARAAVSKTLTSTAATRGESYVQKQRAKKRAAANAESIARGAELARNRAKASKSRKLET